MSRSLVMKQGKYEIVEGKQPLKLTIIFTLNSLIQKLRRKSRKYMRFVVN